MEKVKIHDITQDGRGVGRLESGRVIMVPGCFPGDEISADVQETKSAKGALSGTLNEIIVNSPHRGTHPCDHFSQGCSGSILGALKYEYTTDWKLNHLSETLRRIGGVKNSRIEPIIPSIEQWNYRDRIELQVVPEEAGLRPAFHGLDGPVPVKSCSLAMPSINKVLKSIKLGFSESDEELFRNFKPRLLLRDNGHDEAVAVLFLFCSPNLKVPVRFKDWLLDLDLAGWQIRLAKTTELRFSKSTTAMKRGKSDISIKTSIGEISADPTVFTQVNRSMADTLIKTALAHAPDGGKLLDLYGGYGAFGLEYAIRGGNAEVIDSAGASVAAGGKFAKRKDLAVVFNTLDLNKNPFLIGVKSTRDACIVDPPRSGIGQKMRKWLQIKGPKRLIYVSCHPAALARDISALSDYKPVVFYPVDMFPNTPDVETIAIFDKKS
ncbi:MAG: class I SAM-dependent RNA methyltransferase [Calditrichaeota bacterium]|nr:class I SAM-dependent RNA methyltransferase [Calditrichota bacterium]